MPLSTVKVTLDMPVDLYARLTRRADDDHASLEAAIIDCLRKNTPATDLPRRASVSDDLPQHSELRWGEASSRRWNDLRAHQAPRASDRDRLPSK
ncbi:MAG: hypothetical protein JWP29_4476 [Rhodoferax sp.]|nr:hypothetical protein [Rhodoferax sp.]